MPTIAALNRLTDMKALNKYRRQFEEQLRDGGLADVNKGMSVSLAIEIMATDALLAAHPEYAYKKCDGCDGTGIICPINEGLKLRDGTRLNSSEKLLERCDTCQRYKSDEAAARKFYKARRIVVDDNGFHHLAVSKPIRASIDMTDAVLADKFMSVLKDIAKLRQDRELLDSGGDYNLPDDTAVDDRSWIIDQVREFLDQLTWRRVELTLVPKKPKNNRR